MAKKIVAVTNIKHNDEFFEVGQDIDHSKFNKEQLRELLDAGAIALEEVVVKKETPDRENSLPLLKEYSVNAPSGEEETKE